jgi:cellobiose phosphorylase
MFMEKLPFTFHDDERKISFDRFDLPAPWINYLSNGRMHAFVSQAGGGMAWWLSPMMFRLTRYRFYHLPIDSPGFYVYIRMADGTAWSPAFRPCETKVDAREASHAPGYSAFTASRNGLTATLKLFMAQDYEALLWDVTLKNESGKEIACDIYAYVELSQFLANQETLLGYYLKWNTRAVYEEELQAITYAYTAWMHPRKDESPLVFFASDEKADSYCCNRDVFCGNYRDERNPVEIEKGVLSNTALNGGEPCAALHRHVIMAANTEKKLEYYLGIAKGALSDYEKAYAKVRDILRALRTPGVVAQQFQKGQAWWQEHLSAYQCQIPDADAQREINIWNPLQSVQTARYSRSISSDASGVRGIGFRDSAQDMLAQAYRKPEWAYEMLEYLASQQFEDGHPVHIMWPEEKRPAQDITRSDNHLWIVYLAYAIVAESGDLSLLDRQIPFLAPDMLNHTGSATLWEHLLRGIDFTEKHLGEHGLPLILFSDWNDHLGPFGRKGKGESVMVSQQLIYALRQMSELAEMRGDQEAVKRFAARIRQQEEALEKYAWDGAWYLRGLDDEGKPIGTHTAENMRIWLNTQSWMIISGAGKREQELQAMDSAKAQLDTGLGLLLNAPGFPGWPDQRSAMVNGLPAGYSENGGVFCQANCWAIMAEALLGRGDRAWQYYKQLLPTNIIKKVGVDRYHAEAYAYCSTLLGVANEKFGWGCVSQVTGTAAWMDVVATQYILGIRPTLKGLLIDPSIPSDWNDYTVERRYRGCKLTIQVYNPDHVQNGVRAISVNGIRIDAKDGNCIPADMLSGCDNALIEVALGN